MIFYVIYVSSCYFSYYDFFCADLSKKPKSVKAIYIHISEKSRYALSKNDMVYRGQNHSS